MPSWNSGNCEERSIVWKLRGTPDLEKTQLFGRSKEAEGSGCGFKREGGVWKDRMMEDRILSDQQVKR